jgi:hypothetical protein
VGMTITAEIHQAVLRVSASSWTSAMEPGGHIREGASAADLSGNVLDGWPDDMRLFSRKERSHPGAQLRIIDVCRGGFLSKPRLIWDVGRRRAVTQVDPVHAAPARSRKRATPAPAAAQGKSLDTERDHRQEWVPRYQQFVHCLVLEWAYPIPQLAADHPRGLKDEHGHSLPAPGRTGLEHPSGARQPRPGLEVFLCPWMPYMPRSTAIYSRARWGKSGVWMRGRRQTAVGFMPPIVRRGRGGWNIVDDVSDQIIRTSSVGLNAAASSRTDVSLYQF